MCCGRSVSVVDPNPWDRDHRLEWALSSTYNARCLSPTPRTPHTSYARRILPPTLPPTLTPTLTPVRCEEMNRACSELIVRSISVGTAIQNAYLQYKTRCGQATASRAHGSWHTVCWRARGMARGPSVVLVGVCARQNETNPLVTRPLRRPLFIHYSHTLPAPHLRAMIIHGPCAAGGLPHSVQSYFASAALVCQSQARVG